MMTPRGLLTTIGAAALGFGIVVGGAPIVQDVFAQEATPPVVGLPAQSQQEVDFEAERAAAYDAFVAALASELGSDETAVDAAIRAALTRQVDEREAAGELDTEDAAALRAVIEVSEAPLPFGLGGRGGPHGFAGHDGRHGRGGHGGFEGRGPRGGFADAIGDLPDDLAPESLPSDDGASDQGAPQPSTPAEDTIL
jgi:hypothetical protein